MKSQTFLWFVLINFLVVFPAVGWLVHPVCLNTKLASKARLVVCSKREDFIQTQLTLSGLTHLSDCRAAAGPPCGPSQLRTYPGLSGLQTCLRIPLYNLTGTTTTLKDKKLNMKSNIEVILTLLTVVLVHLLWVIPANSTLVVFVLSLFALNRLQSGLWRQVWSSDRQSGQVSSWLGTPRESW